MAFKTTNFFFDRALVKRSMDDVSLRAMFRSGSSIKVIAQRSMRYRKSPSQPGTPPSSHRTESRSEVTASGKPKKMAGLLRRALFNAYDPTTKRHLIGPEGLGRAIVPRLMEEGGTAAVSQVVARPRAGRPMSAAAKAAFRRKVAAGQIQTTKALRVYRIARYPARPYMRPALKTEMTRYPKRWAGQLKAVGRLRSAA